ncbi:MAG: hypothetical protein HQL50_01935 [Magnetococcales bacterium]|nr:hypothetical protein [Magnetococcales bacterium]
MSDVYKRHAPFHSLYIKEIAEEIRSYGGNSIANVIRGGGPSYRSVVRDVAKKLKTDHARKATTEEMEMSILLKIVDDAWTTFSDDEKRSFFKSLGVKGAQKIPSIFPTIAVQAAIRMSGFSAYQIAILVANAMAKRVLGHGLRMGANAALTRTVGALTGPIGWVITGLWTIVDIAGPAFRVTIPSVIHVAMLRQKQKASTQEDVVIIDP